MFKNHVKWQRPTCDGCKHYNPECRQGACGLYPYVIRKIHTPKVKEHDSS